MESIRHHKDTPEEIKATTDELRLIKLFSTQVQKDLKNFLDEREAKCVNCEKEIEQINLWFGKAHIPFTNKVFYWNTVLSFIKIFLILYLLAR